jgi:hypothetical protein
MGAACGRRGPSRCRGIRRVLPGVHLTPTKGVAKDRSYRSRFTEDQLTYAQVLNLFENFGGRLIEGALQKSVTRRVKRQLQLVRFIECLSTAPEYYMIVQRSPQLSQQGRNVIVPEKSDFGKTPTTRAGRPGLRENRVWGITLSTGRRIAHRILWSQNDSLPSRYLCGSRHLLGLPRTDG